jgi:superfamily II DNA helicase RecQ
VKEVVANVSKHVWRTPVLRERQSLALSTKGLVGTSSCDTGLDHLLLLFIILCEFPRDLLSYIQRRGRAGRQGEAAKCHLMASFSDYSFTAIQIEASIHSSNGNKRIVRDPTMQSYYGADGKVIQITSYMNRYKNFNAYKGLALIHDSKRRATCYNLVHDQKESTNEINTAEKN